MGPCPVSAAERRPQHPVLTVPGAGCSGQATSLPEIPPADATFSPCAHMVCPCGSRGLSSSQCGVALMIHPNLITLQRPHLPKHPRNFGGTLSSTPGPPDSSPSFMPNTLTPSKAQALTGSAPAPVSRTSAHISWELSNGQCRGVNGRLLRGCHVGPFCWEPGSILSKTTH